MQYIQHNTIQHNTAVKTLQFHNKHRHFIPHGGQYVHDTVQGSTAVILIVLLLRTSSSSD